MLAEESIDWTREWKQQGHKEGRQEGFLQGLAAEKSLLIRQARKRFGQACANALAVQLEPEMDTERLADIGEWLVTCATGEDFLSRLPQ